MKKLGLICFFLFTQTFAFSQIDRLLRFSVVPVDNNQKVQVRWTMNAGSTCSDVVVERSIDSINFNEVYVYPSICGDADVAVSYSWIDPEPSQSGPSYYRLKLDGIEFSLISVFNVGSILKESEILVFPNPSNGVFTVEFKNPKKEKFDVLFYASNGSLLFHEKNLIGNSYSPYLSNIESGIYTIKIQFENSNSESIKVLIR